MEIFKSPKCHGFAVRCSPWNPEWFAYAGATNFGMSGSGRVFIQTLSGATIAGFEYPDAIFDLAWNELTQDFVAAGAGDGSVIMWKFQSTILPLKEHSREVSSLSWEHFDKQHVFSSSWDGSIKMWHPNLNKSKATFTGHIGRVNQVVYSPHQRNQFASVGEDGAIKIWSTLHSDFIFNVGFTGSEILCFEYDKKQPFMLFVGCKSGRISSWDMRKPDTALYSHQIHKAPIKKIVFDPHHSRRLATCSFDSTIVVWDTGMQQPKARLGGHSEFVQGIDFNPHCSDQLLSCSWDEKVLLHTLHS